MGKLGETLQERRLALGISIEHAEEQTKMRARLLSALEAGDYDRLPDPGYVRGYISSYARYLELDPLPLLAMYKAETGTTTTSQLDLPQAEEAVAPAGQQHALPLRTGVIVLIAVGVLSLSVWMVTSVLSGPEPTPPVPVPPTESVEASDPAPDASEPPATTNPPSDEEQPAAEDEPGGLAPFTLGVTVVQNGASWVRVTVDGKLAYEGTLAGGQSKTFEVAEEAEVRIGKRESVTLTRDGQPVDMRGDGDVPTVTLKAEPVQ